VLHRHSHLTDLQCTDATTAAAWADRSARLDITANGTPVGTLGLLTKRSRRLAEIDTVQVACFELDLDRLSVHESRDNHYQPVPELPDADFDLSIIVADSVTWSRIHATVAAANELIHRVTFLDEFRGTWIPAGHRSVTCGSPCGPRTPHSPPTPSPPYERKRSRSSNANSAPTCVSDAAVAGPDRMSNDAQAGR
jgi:phenylalanyl-tRNA synthetase beta chain